MTISAHLAISNSMSSFVPKYWLNWQILTKMGPLKCTYLSTPDRLVFSPKLGHLPVIMIPSIPTPPSGQKSYASVRSYHAFLFYLLTFWTMSTKGIVKDLQGGGQLAQILGRYVLRVKFFIIEKPPKTYKMT